MDIRRFFWIFPGRTDRQVFSVAMWPGLGEADVMRTAVQAWANGWAPPDSASETWR
jgi:hypothetical protein